MPRSPAPQSSTVRHLTSMAAGSSNAHEAVVHAYSITGTNALGTLANLGIRDALAHRCSSPIQTSRSFCKTNCVQMMFPSIAESDLDGLAVPRVPPRCTHSCCANFKILNSFWLFQRQTELPTGSNSPSKGSLGRKQHPLWPLQQLGIRTPIPPKGVDMSAHLVSPRSGLAQLRTYLQIQLVEKGQSSSYTYLQENLFFCLNIFETIVLSALRHPKSKTC